MPKIPFDFFLKSQSKYTHPNLLQGIATDRIRQIFFSILEPAVESGRLLGERQVQLLDLKSYHNIISHSHGNKTMLITYLLVLFLHLQQFLATIGRVVQQALPTSHHVGMTFLDGRTLLMFDAN